MSSTTLKSLFARLRALISNKEPAYFSEYRVSPGTRLPSISAQLAEGLEAWHIVSDGTAACRVVAYWKTQGHFALGNLEFARQLGTACESSGWVGPSRAALEPLSKRLSVGKAALWLAAFIGAVNVIVPFFGGLVATPSLGITHSERPVHAIQGDPIDLSIGLRNQNRTTQTGIQVSTTLQRQTPELAVKPTPAKALTASLNAPELGAYEITTVTVAGDTIEHGMHVITFTASAEWGWLMGLFTGPKHFSKKIYIEVWPAVPQVSLTAKSGAPPYGSLFGTVLVGPEAKSGIDCEVVLAELPPKMSLVGFHQDPAPLEAARMWGEPTAKRRVIAWASPPITMKTKVRFRIDMSGPANTAWADIPKRAQATCDYRR